MFKFLRDLLISIRGPKTATEADIDYKFFRPLSTCAVLHDGTLFISSIIYPPGSPRIKDSWSADVRIFLIVKGDLKKIQLVGPTYEAVIGMIRVVVKSYE